MKQFWQVKRVDMAGSGGFSEVGVCPIPHVRKEIDAKLTPGDRVQRPSGAVDAPEPQCVDDVEVIKVSPLERESKRFVRETSVQYRSLRSTRVLWSR